MSENELKRAVRNLSKMQKKDYARDNPRWNNSKSLVNQLLKNDAGDRMTPYKFKQSLKEKLGK